ncbi:hypothetical protein ID866_8773 [Astraeus odoratus]|nr:hypothetical protein ID866_8773 [Astraeus odoratus]
MNLDLYGLPPKKSSNSVLGDYPMFQILLNGFSCSFFSFRILVIGKVVYNSCHGERLIERSAEQFWKEKSEILGNIPTIVVFTKYDKLVNIMKLRSPDDPQLEAERHLRTNCIQPIQNFSGEENISHMALPPANKGYEQGQKDLIQLTFEKVLERFTPQQNGPSPVPVTKTDGGIHPCLKGYWRAIAASPNFEGYTIRDCLHVIHTDIISVWNFYDPDNVRDVFFSCRYAYHYLKCLTSEQFRDYMLDMIADIGDIGLSETHTKADDEVDIEQCGLSLITLLPITLPFTAGAKLVRWVSETYQRIPNIQQKFIVYIVDLTHILEILFALTANNSAKKLTRRSIKIAYKAYLESSLKRTIHSDVRDFHGAGIITGGRDLILEKIELFLQTSYTSDVPLSRVLSKVPQASLDMDEEWST